MVALCLLAGAGRAQSAPAGAATTAAASVAPPASVASPAPGTSPASVASPAPGASPASVASPAPGTSPAPVASPASAASPSPAGPTKAERIRAAKEEIANRYATRKAAAAQLVVDLKACTAAMKDGQARREAEKAITNLESAIGKADAEAAKGVYRKAFVALGRPAKAAQAALRRCQSGARSQDQDE